MRIPNLKLVPTFALSCCLTTLSFAQTHEELVNQISSNDKLATHTPIAQGENGEEESSLQNNFVDENEEHLTVYQELTEDYEEQSDDYENVAEFDNEQGDIQFDALDNHDYELPGEDVNFRIKLHTSTHHLVNGKAHSKIGKALFKSRLMPSNEVKLSLKLKQREAEDVELTAYFDLAHFTMELDGSNSILNTEHKRLLKLVSTHLKHKFEEQYAEYGFPEHVLMLVQMLGYWSVSPEGFIHEKRTIVSN